MSKNKPKNNDAMQIFKVKLKMHFKTLLIHSLMDHLGFILETPGLSTPL